MERNQERVVQKGLEQFRLMGEESPGIFDRLHWAGELLRLAMERLELKVRLFRFIDVMPSLSSDEMVASHLRENNAVQQRFVSLFP
jgi:RHH-type proline utilization regulon transcriptional repressor/proline dehydrogenase/delta 1-pyrroline-5-carboxylate dehydrogenase